MCMLMWPWPDPKSRSRSQSILTSKIVRNCTFLRLPPPPLPRGAQNWWLVVTVWDLVYSLSEPIFEFPYRKAIRRVQTSRNVNISRNSNGHISIVREATVRRLGMLVVLQLLCMLIWPWPDPRSRSRSRSFWSSENWRSLACWRRWPPVPLRGFLVACHPQSPFNLTLLQYPALSTLLSASLYRILPLFLYPWSLARGMGRWDLHRAPEEAGRQMTSYAWECQRVRCSWMSDRQ